MVSAVNPFDLEKRASYLLNVSAFIKNAEKYDEVQRKAQELLAEAAGLRITAANGT